MSNLDCHSGRSSLQVLAHRANELLDIKRCLEGTLTSYASLADCALADVLEMFSGIAFELSGRITAESLGNAEGVGNEDLQITLAVEPLSYDDAAIVLP